MSSVVSIPRPHRRTAAAVAALALTAVLAGCAAPAPPPPPPPAPVAVIPQVYLSPKLVEQAAAGLCVPAGDRQAFVAAAGRLRAESHTSGRFGAAGRAYAENAFSISSVADRFEATFGKAVGRSRGSS